MLFSCLLLLGSPVASQQFGRNKVQIKDYKWRILSTPHFDIHFYEGEEGFAVRAGLVLENGYQMLADKLNSDLPWKVPIILYSSHNDFLQTNISEGLLPEGVQAFAEPSRKRIVLPFTGSFQSFQHTAIHELAHVFTFNIVYNKLMDSVFSRNYLFSLPLWVVEGVAEYLSVGWDADSDMFIRDAVIYDYLVDLDYAGGFYVYKEGQSVFNYIADTYGKEKVIEILRVLSTTRRSDLALEHTIGIDTRELSRQWEKSLRKHYWPMYADKKDVEDLGRKLTDHVKDHGYYNTKPVFSPDGDKIAFFSDRDGLTDVYLMSALDGKVLKKLVSGERSNRFESLHSFTSSLSFSPDGSMIALVAKSKGRDVLYLIDTGSGKVKRRIDVYADALSAPDWSPMGDKIVVTAVARGQSDLVLVDLETGSYKKLTNDPADQLTPRFFPDGRTIVYTHYPEVTIPTPNVFDGKRLKLLREMDFLSSDNVQKGASLDIYTMDVATAASKPLVTTKGDDTSPVVFDQGKRVLFTSNESGINNLYVVDVETGKYRRLTDVLGGIFTPDVNEKKRRVTFSAFVNGGWDIYVSDDFDELLKNDYSSEPPPIEVAKKPVDRNLVEQGGVETQGASAESGVDSTRSRVRAALPVPAEADSTLAAVVGPGVESKGFEPAAGSGLERNGGLNPSPADSIVEGLHTPVTGREVKNRGATVVPYKTRLSPDFIGQGAGLYFSTGLGFGLSNTIALSDILGNHRMLFSFNFFRDLEDSDFLFTYFYLKNRIDYGFGIFQFKNFLNSRISTIGEDFLDYRLFTERNYGVFGLVSVPFNTFNRMDLEFEGFVSEREFFDRVEEDPLTGQLFLVAPTKSRRRLIEPTLSFVHDASFYNRFGPVEGSRWIVSVSKGIAFGGSDVSRSTGFLDYRWYKRLFYRNSIAFRLALAASEGSDPRSFFLGGPVTLRGYDYLAFQGTRIALSSIEYRYPMIDAFILGWPTRWGFTNIGGTLFFDIGSAWEKGDITPFKKGVNRLQLEDLHADFGFGTYLSFGYLLLNFQFAWQTDLHSVGDQQFHFFLGPAF
jgi:Tol biopolymer transport system component